MRRLQNGDIVVVNSDVLLGEEDGTQIVLRDGEVVTVIDDVVEMMSVGVLSSKGTVRVPVAWLKKRP